jgi:2-hydroxy-3-keto-5-methylthiopentenyl-1-phosphate phosphatase
MKLGVLTDFDGTVTLNDTFENVLEKFGQGDWRAVDDQYVKGEITLEECLRRQGGMVRASKPQIDKVQLSTAVAKCTPTGIKFDFLKLKDNRSMNLKDDAVRYYKTRADTVAYIGDGRWDLHALRNADLRFATKNSKLAELCKEQEIQATIISDFKEMVVSLKKEMLERDNWQGESE